MAMENKRIIQLNTERTTPAGDDFVMVDSATDGTAKYQLSKITDAINQEISNRTAADTTLQGNITAEATARAAADTAINGEITQLKEDLSNVSQETIMDKSTGVKLSAYINNRSTPMMVKSDIKTITVYFPCVPNATYTINKMLSARFRVGYTVAVPADSVQIYGVIADNDATFISLTTGSDAQYIVIYYYDSANDTESESTIYDSLEVTYNTAVDKVARVDIKALESNVSDLESSVSDLDDDLDGKVDKQQGFADAGKALIIGDDGVVYPKEIDTSGGLSDEAKTALLNCFAHVAWIDEHGQDYYDALETALYEGEYPKIIATFDSGLNVVYTDDSLDTLKQYLTVKYYETEESAGTVVTAYTLSGNLADGTNAITVSYGGKTTTFNVVAVDFYNVMEWDSTSDDIVQVYWGNQNWENGSRDNHIGTIKHENMSNPNRCWLAFGRGKQQVYAMTSGTDYGTPSGFYPMPIPSDATNMKVTFPSGMRCGLNRYHWNGESYDYKVRDHGWLTDGEVTFDALENTFGMLLIGYIDNRAFTESTLPSSVKVEFS